MKQINKITVFKWKNDTLVRETINELIDRVNKFQIEFVEEAPKDGQTYARRDGVWVEVVDSGSISSDLVTNDSSVVGTTLTEALNNLLSDFGNHINDFNNPHNVTKAQVGLGNVDNTSDLDKPVSVAVQTALDDKQDLLISGVNIKTINFQDILGSGNLVISAGATAWGDIFGTLSDQTDLQAALDLKLEASDISDFETTSQLDTRDSANRDRTNHTGTQPISTVDGLETALDNLQDEIDKTYQTWIYLVSHWSNEPTEIAVLYDGVIFEYTLGPITRYRFVPEPYSSIEDAFYEDFDGTNLINLITTRG
jgi:hypothetical protein